MPSNVHPRKLLVEGKTDKRVIPYLIEANGVKWERCGEHVVHIDPRGGFQELAKPGVIAAELRATGLKALGVVLDANSNAPRRWKQIKTHIDGEFERLPDQMPRAGLDVIHPQGPRFGVWIMPDNHFAGMLEDFLIGLIPDDSKDVFELARRCTKEAATNGAPFKPSHQTKAEVHTWLAWQDEPGKQLHQAVEHGIFDPQALGRDHS